MLKVLLYITLWELRKGLYLALRIKCHVLSVGVFVHPVHVLAHPLQVLPQDFLWLREVKQRLHSLSVEVWFESPWDWSQGASPPNAQVNQIKVPDVYRSFFSHHFSGISTTDST